MLFLVYKDYYSLMKESSKIKKKRRITPNRLSHNLNLVG